MLTNGHIMEEKSCFSHKVYKNDPVLLKSYIGKEVSVLTENGRTDSGIVYTIDPVSESIVLLQKSESNQLKIVFGYAVKSIEVHDEKPCDLNKLFVGKQTNLDPAAVTKRKNAVMLMLKENLFPVKEEKDVLVIQDVLSIRPPYKPSDCICTNSVILDRIQCLLSSVKV